jgi:hypothetical protein
MYRVHVFRLNLDLDRALERVEVYDIHQGEMSTPVTYFRVSDRHGDTFTSVQLQLVFQSPGSSDSGLVQAWVRDLNGDTRKEIAVRDFATPSVGEALTLYRQRKAHSLDFSKLQTIVGDRVGMAGRRTPATWKILIKANHAPDGRDHHELWRWVQAEKKWICKADCVPR